MFKNFLRLYLHNGYFFKQSLSSSSLETLSSAPIIKQSINSTTKSLNRIILSQEVTMLPRKICIIGSGNWGMAISKIIGKNVLVNDRFQDDVPMYVYEEIVNNQKLTDIINQSHENPKYLPGIKIPDNIIATSDLDKVVDKADILIFVMPHQFINRICAQIQGKIKDTAVAISLIKGLDISDGKIDLISNMIRRSLNIPCAVLMGANIALEVALEYFCEATIGCYDVEMGKSLKELFHTPYFRINVVPEEETVELCGALKNVVAIGAGIVDGLEFGGNTKAAVIRLGLLEIVQFCNKFFTKARTELFLESCGFADLVTTCYCGRNRKVAEAFVRAKGTKSLEELEAEILSGQKLQGPTTAAEVYQMLLLADSLQDFPLFTAIHRICIGQLEPSELITCLAKHP